MIPMVDLKTQYLSLKEEIDSEVLSVLGNTQFIQGPNVKRLEIEIASYLGIDASRSLTVASGTDALHLALESLNPCSDDEIITTPFSFISSAWPASYVKSKLVFVDIDSKTFNIDLNLLKKSITKRTKAIIPVHLFGQTVDMESLMSIIDGRNITVVEDCAQAFGAISQGKKVGTIGDFGCYSFFPSKNLGCYGDGGLIITKTNSSAEKIKMLRNHGSKKRYFHDIVGFNSRLDEVQAAILRVKLKRIDSFNASRRLVADQYKNLIKNKKITMPFVSDEADHVFHQFTILCDNRDELQKHLKENGISSAIYYPIPIHKQKIYELTNGNDLLPVVASICEQCLSLPIYPELNSSDIHHIASVINKF